MDIIIILVFTNVFWIEFEIIKIIKFPKTLKKFGKIIEKIFENFFSRKIVCDIYLSTEFNSGLEYDNQNGYLTL